MLTILEKKVDGCGLTRINKAARNIEKMADWFDLHTRFYNWIPYYYYFPALFIGMRHLLPAPLDGFVGKHFYGGTPPKWESNLDAWIPVPSITNTADLKGLGPWEVRYDKFVKTFIIISMAKQWNIRKKSSRTYSDSVPQTLYQKIHELWDRLKGIPVVPDYYYDIVDDIDFEDDGLIGLDHQKTHFKDAINYLSDPEAYLSRGLVIEKGILLIGPSGAGKNSLVRSWVGTVNKLFKQQSKNFHMSLIELKHDEFTQDDGTESFGQFIKQAQSRAPCVIFIDELHTHLQGNPHLYNTLLAALDASYSSNDPRDQLFVICSTSRPDLLPEELRTHKRLGKVIRFTLPDYNERCSFFTQTLVKELALDADSLDIESYARQTTGCSYSQLQTVIAQAKFKTGKNFTTRHEDIQAALNQEIHYLIERVTLSDREKEFLSAHLVGHALISYLLKPSDEIEFVTIHGHHNPIPKQACHLDSRHEQFKVEYGKIFTYNPSEALDLVDDQDIEKKRRFSVSRCIS